MTKDKGEGRAKRPLSEQEDASAAPKPVGAPRGRPRKTSGDGAAAKATATRPAKRPAQRRPSAPVAAARESSVRSDDDGEREQDEGGEGEEQEHEQSEEGDEPAEGEVIDVAGELIDEELSVDADGARIVDRTLKTDKPTGDHDDSAALSRTDPLQAYLREVQRHKLLTPDEEKDLTQKFVKSQDPRTAARLVTANLRLVVKLAYEYRRAYKNIMDLIQEGTSGSCRR